jgi:glutaredoxin
MYETVTLYGMSRCPRTRMLRLYLASLQVPCAFCDIEHDGHARRRAEVHHRGDLLRWPCIGIGDLVVSDPSTTQLRAVLSRRGLLPQ